MCKRVLKDEQWVRSNFTKNLYCLPGDKKGCWTFAEAPKQAKGKKEEGEGVGEAASDSPKQAVLQAAQ